jgi:hypothetical protein
MGPLVLRVSILRDGKLLLNGGESSVGELSGALQEADRETTAVWFYREDAGSEPPAEALEVLRLITGKRLPVSLSSQPDFSDYVDDRGVSRPRSGSETTAPEGPDQIFGAARREASKDLRLVVVRPDWKILAVPAPPRNSVRPELTALMETILPASSKGNIAAIANTGFKADGGAGSLQAANQAIPFFGILLGLSTIGHAVWVFDGRAEALEAGCRDADLLIIDLLRIPGLAKGWEKTVPGVMRNPRIVVFDRRSGKLRPLRLP